MNIAGHSLSAREQPYIIAEIGVNHFDIAKKRQITPLDAAELMINEAADSGADAVKFQSYTAEKLASKLSPAYWDTSEEPTDSQYDLFKKYDSFGKSEFTALREVADEADVDFLSTPFDSQSVEYLEQLVPAFKVASADITNVPLLREIARTDKPVLLSTGASTVGEIDDALRTIRSETDAPVAVLHCVLQYPTDPENANLAMITHLDDIFFDAVVGYSDHVPPDAHMTTLMTAETLGAKIIEKHFTLDSTIPGNDHYHAMEPSDLQTFRELVSHKITLTGSQQKQPLAVEQDARTYARRSIVAARDIAEGEQFTAENTSVKRPGTGISPKQIDLVLTKCAKRPIQDDQVLTWSDVC